MRDDNLNAVFFAVVSSRSRFGGERYCCCGSGCIDGGATAHFEGGADHGGIDDSAHGGGCACNLSGDPTFGGHPQFGGFEGGISVTVPIGGMPIF